MAENITIRVSSETKKLLNEIRYKKQKDHKNHTYDNIVSELIEEEEARRYANKN